MEYFLYVISGAVAGILGGMGMGGGTLLIPILTIFFNVNQHMAQAINLISFIPMAVVALIFHLKNKLVCFKKILLIILPGLISCFIFCFVAKRISSDVLQKIFGGFLLLLSIYQFYTAVKSKK